MAQRILVTTINHDLSQFDVSRAFGNTTDVHTPGVPENRENLLLVETWGRLMLKLDGWLGFLLRLAVAIHHCLSRVVLLFKKEKNTSPPLMADQSRPASKGLGKIQSK